MIAPVSRLVLVNNQIVMVTLIVIHKTHHLTLPRSFSILPLRRLLPLVLMCSSTKEMDFSLTGIL